MIGRNRWAEQDKKQLITQLYIETGRAKIESVCRYITDLIAQEPSRKFLVFAHHKEMLDGIEGVLISKVLFNFKFSIFLLLIMLEMYIYAN